MHQIWVEYNKKGKIVQCWEAPDPVAPGDPDISPISMEYEDKSGRVRTRSNTIRRVNPPSDLAALLEERKQTGLALSRLILERKKVNPKTGKLVKKGVE